MPQQGPQRNESPVGILGVDLLKIEQALLFRADRLDDIAHALLNNIEGEDPAVLGARAEVRRAMAIEHRMLAEELHHW